MSLPVIVYTIPNCPYCVRAKNLLTANSVPYQEVLIDPYDDDVRQELQDRSGMRTFPQIFFGDKCIGGFTELADLDLKVGIKKAFA
jgi:glutaredoxin 3